MPRLDIRTVDIRRAVSDVPPYGTNPLPIRCPKHKDDSESLMVYPDHIHCMGCPFRVQKRMDALAFLLKLPTWKDALAVAHKYVFLSETEAQARRQASKPRRKPTKSEVRIYRQMLGDRIEWLLNRGLSQETVRVNNLGHNGAAFVIPVYDGHMELVTLRYRNDEDICGKYDVEYDEDFNVVRTRKIPKYRGWSGCNDACLYPAWKFEPDRRDFVVLCEGELDALLLWQQDIPTITATNGAGQQGLVLDLLQQFFEDQRTNPRRRPTLQRVVICGDRDMPGITAARKLFERAREEYPEVVWLQWPEELGKDISEVLAKGYSFEQIYETYGFEEDRSPTAPTGDSGHGTDGSNTAGEPGDGGAELLATRREDVQGALQEGSSGVREYSPAA